MDNRVILIVLDSVGIGHAPDADRYRDSGANTLGNIARAVGGLRVPHLAGLGLGRIHPIEGVPVHSVRGAYGDMVPQSSGKDTTNGHLEFVGVTLSEPLPTYPSGFPPEIMEPFEQMIGRKTLGNVSASGTEIIKRLGDNHVASGEPIVYTSADSVFQIAAHEDVIDVSELYRMCEIARSLLTGPHAVGRVIARPFAGESGAFYRTANRKDFSRSFGPTLLTELARHGVSVIGIGKIGDIYGGEGIAAAIHTEGNDDGVNRTLAAMDDTRGPALIFANLVDFDMLYGHRNDPVGFGAAIEAFDRRLPEVIGQLRPNDLLLITADHGCDPTIPGTDHSREAVPLLAYHPKMQGSVALGRRSTFADLGATIAAHVSVPWGIGESFYERLNEVML